MAREVQLHEVQRLAKRPCPKCGDRWRKVTVNPQETRQYGMRCYVNGHKTTGQFATMSQAPSYRRAA